MYLVNDDLSIYVTRGDILCMNVSATQDDSGLPYEFQPGDIVRIKVYGKRDAENVVLQKDFPVVAKTDAVGIMLTEEDTKIGDVISKPTDYWYEIELNPFTNPQTLVGYDEDGAKIFKLFPEGRDLHDEPTKPEDIPVVDKDLDLVSSRPVENKAISRAITLIKNDLSAVDERLSGRVKASEDSNKSLAAEVAAEKARFDNLIAPDNKNVSVTLGYVESITDSTKSKYTGRIDADGVFANVKVTLHEANLIYGGTEIDMFIIPTECRPWETGLIHTEDGLEYRIKYDGTNDRYYMSIKAESSVTVAPSGAGTVTMSYKLSDHEVKDIRVGADGTTYATAGEAVRRQFDYMTAESNALKSTKEFSLMHGSFTDGVVEPATIRVCFMEEVKACRTVVSMIANGEYMYGYAVYDENGNYDGVDHGWNTMDGNPIFIDSGYFRMNFRKIDNGEMGDADIVKLKDYVKITQINILEDVDILKKQVNDGVYKIMPFKLEIGSLADGEKLPFTSRARFVDRVKVDERTVATILPNSNYLYGYCFYDESGVFDGVDHGWITAFNQPTVTFDRNGYVMFNFRRADSGDITDEDLAVLAEMLTIATRATVLDVDADVRELEDKVNGVSCKSDAISSISVEHGRVNGASYVFVRIPKTTNNGKALHPKLHLTSVDGSIDGSKVSALNFAKREGSIFTMNAGLFNTKTLQPVGQTIIDGVSYVNEPMTDDMGNPISDIECYPLCVDAEGNLSAPYPRSVDTADMIADGVVYAVTGWGKIVDNFKACADTVENEIVHAETYIRQVIGQFQNGDYFVCTVDKSRSHVQNEAGLTYKDLAQLLVDKGVKFAYSLDGGGSAETVIGVRQINPIYEGAAGRAVPTVITFE